MSRKTRDHVEELLQNVKVLANRNYEITRNILNNYKLKELFLAVKSERFYSIYNLIFYFCLFFDK